MRRQKKEHTSHEKELKAPDKEKLRAIESKKADWDKWLEHWETWNAIVADVKPPGCGLFGCDEKVKVRDKWKCVACGKITET